MQTDPLPSRASPLPQFVLGKAQDWVSPPTPCGSQACSRWLRFGGHCCRLILRYREQAWLTHTTTTGIRRAFCIVLLSNAVSDALFAQVQGSPVDEHLVTVKNKNIG